MIKGKIENTFASLENISKSFGKINALNNVNIDIEKNKITAIVGDNGSGKSTLIKILSGSLKPDSGNIYIDGENYKYLTPKLAIKILSGSLKPDSGNIYIDGENYKYLTPKLAHEKGISTVYQDLSLDNYRDVSGNIFLGRELTKYGFILDYERMEDETETLLKDLDIHIPYFKTPVGYLSGGQRQSVAIARAIFQGKNLIIFDEPTAAMGVKETKATNELIKSLPDRGFTVLVISHDMHQVLHLADRIFIMEHGEIIDNVSKTNITVMDLMERISNGS